MKRRAAFLIVTDENGVDPRQNPHDTAHMGHAPHGLGGAAPVVASKQTGPAPHRSHRRESTPADPAVRVERPSAACRTPAMDK